MVKQRPNKKNSSVGGLTLQQCTRPCLGEIENVKMNVCRDAFRRWKLYSFRVNLYGDIQSRVLVFAT